MPECYSESQPHVSPLEPRDLSRDVRVERESQRLLDQPEAFEEILSLFEDDLEQHYYALMRNHLPAKAAYYIAKTLRQTTFAAMSSAVYVNMLHEITPELEKNGNLDVFYTQNEAEFHPEIGASPGIGVLTGSAAQFMHRLTTHLWAASQRVLESAVSDPTGPNYFLWQALETAHLQLKATIRDEAGPPASMQTAWMGSMEGNASTVLELLLNCGHSQTHEHYWGATFNNRSLGRTALRNIDELAWSATSKRSYIVPMLHRNAFSQEFPRYEGRERLPLEEFSAKRRRMLGTCVHEALALGYHHPSLKEGPWPRGSFCPGVPHLQPKAQADREIVERFFVWLEKRYGRSVPRSLDERNRGDGGFDRVTMAIMIGVVVAEETIYKAWPEVINIHFNDPSDPYERSSH